LDHSIDLYFHNLSTNSCWQSSPAAAAVSCPRTLSYACRQLKLCYSIYHIVPAKNFVFAFRNHSVHLGNMTPIASSSGTPAANPIVPPGDNHLNLSVTGAEPLGHSTCGHAGDITMHPRMHMFKLLKNMCAIKKLLRFKYRINRLLYIDNKELV
jgi:hypothetical protein